MDLTDTNAVLKEYRKLALRPNGRLVITDWCDDYVACWVCNLWLRVFDRAHFRTYGQKQCRRLVEQAGFTGVRIDRYKINWLWGLMTAVSQKRAARQANEAGPALRLHARLGFVKE